MVAQASASKVPLTEKKGFFIFIGVVAILVLIFCVVCVVRCRKSGSKTDKNPINSYSNPMYDYNDKAGTTSHAVTSPAVFSHPQDFDTGDSDAAHYEAAVGGGGGGTAGYMTIHADGEMGQPANGDGQAGYMDIHPSADDGDIDEGDAV
jgi:hypothetical protein